MELIPILSTIILVATISTFLLAIGAYILYKVREKKGQQAVVEEPSEIEAELVSPAAIPLQQKQAAGPHSRAAGQKPVSIFQRQPKGSPRRVAQPVPQSPEAIQSGMVSNTPRYTTYQTGERGTQRPKQYSGAGFVQLRGFEGQGYIPRTLAEKRFKDSRYIKYTSLGYTPPENENESGALKWR